MDITSGGTLSGTSTVVAKVQSVERDRVVFTLPDHTAKEPRVIIASRSLSSGGVNGTLKTGFKFVFGDRNSDGSARSGNCIVEIKIATPDDQESSITAAAVVKAYEVLRDSDWMTGNIASGEIPFA